MGPKAYDELCEKLCSHIDKVLDEKITGELEKWRNEKSAPEPQPSDTSALEQKFEQRFQDLSEQILEGRKEVQEVRAVNECLVKRNSELEAEIEEWRRRTREMEEENDRLRRAEQEIVERLRRAGGSCSSALAEMDSVDADDDDDICLLNESLPVYSAGVKCLDITSEGTSEEGDERDCEEACGAGSELYADFKARRAARELDEVRKYGKYNYDILIISDSIMRHVGEVCPKVDEPASDRAKVLKEHRTTTMLAESKPIHSEFWIHGLSVYKVVIPGARVNRLWAEAAVLSRTHDFGHVIAHVGINYIPSPRKNFVLLHREKVESEICEFLDGLAKSFTGKISFSAILPTRDVTFISGITGINRAVASFCESKGYGVMYVHAFTRNLGGLIGPSMFAKDGLHLNAVGIQIVEDAIREYVIEDFKYDFEQHGNFC